MKMKTIVSGAILSLSILLVSCGKTTGPMVPYEVPATQVAASDMVRINYQFGWTAVINLQSSISNIAGTNSNVLYFPSQDVVGVNITKLDNGVETMHVDISYSNHFDNDTFQYNIVDQGVTYDPNGSVILKVK